MNVGPTPEPRPHETAGQEFVRQIRPAGAALFLIVFVLSTVLMFTSGRDPIRGYEAPQTTAYYAEHPDELVRELEENVFPALADHEMTAAVTDGLVVVTIDAAHFATGRSAVLHYFDASLFAFETAE